MRRTNINVILRMVRDFLNGKMDDIAFLLDFPHEIETRYQKMCSEDPDHADLIYYYLVRNGADLYGAMSYEAFRAHIQNQYDNVVEGLY
jgi:hypothetical protein